jgi:hypothetical protein
MDRKSTAVIPESITQLQRQLNEFRSTHAGRTKLPESLWQTAVELAREHGVYCVAHPLRLDYAGLKKRLRGVSSPQTKTTNPAFMELIESGAVPPEEWVIDLESSEGSKMRIQWKSSAPPDWTNLLRAWRDVER